jgi:RHS repeat-associated protein
VNARDELTSVEVPGAAGARVRSDVHYDAAGNFLGARNAAEVSAASGGRHFFHNSENRLLTAVMPGRVVDYVYDPSGRRVLKAARGGAATAFVHAGDMEIADLDAATGAVRQRYVPGAGVDRRVVSIAVGAGANGSGTAQWYHENRLGHVIAMADAAGAVSAGDRYVYTPYGVQTSAALNTGQPFRYTGQRFDAETGLYYYRARYYDAVHGRFLETDPILYEDQINLYAYVGNDPVNGTDPSGAVCEKGGGLCDAINSLFQSGSGHYSEGAERTQSGMAGGVGLNSGAMQQFGGALQMSGAAYGQAGLQGADYGTSGAADAAQRGDAPGVAFGLVLTAIPGPDTPASSAASGVRLRAQLIGEEISAGHAFTKHVNEWKKLGIFDRGALARHIEGVVGAASTSFQQLARGRSAYYDDASNTLIIRNPRDPDGGTAFRPVTGRGYFDELE